MNVYFSIGHDGDQQGMVIHGTTEFLECKKMIEKTIDILKTHGHTCHTVPFEYNKRQRIHWANSHLRSDALVIELQWGKEEEGVRSFYFDGIRSQQRIVSNYLKYFCKDSDIPCLGTNSTADFNSERMEVVRGLRSFGMALRFSGITCSDVRGKLLLRGPFALANIALRHCGKRLISRKKIEAVMQEHTPSFIATLCKKAKKKKLTVDTVNMEKEVSSGQLLTVLTEVGILQNSFIKKRDSKITQQVLLATLDRLSLL